MSISIAIAAVAATCDPWDEPVYDCGEVAQSALYDKRIRPLLEEDRPQSCNQCHLAGIDLGLWLKATPCQTIACMAQEGLVDFDNPPASLVLSWMDRAEPASDLITAAVLAEERQGMLAWIEMNAQCGGCTPDAFIDNPCGGAAQVNDCPSIEHITDTYDQSDPGGCADETIEKLFLGYFFPYRRRCYPCHFDGEKSVGFEDAPKWIDKGPCEEASLATLRTVVERGYIDVQEPAQSLWLLKPLAVAEGGIYHGGGPKFHEGENGGYAEMLYFSERYAACAQAGLQPLPGALDDGY